MTKSQMQNPLLPFESRRTKSRPTNRDVCVFIGIVFFFTICLACQQNKTPLSLTQPQLTLSAEYVAVTEAWLQVQTENISARHQLKVWRDTTVVFNGVLNTADTTVYDSALLPAYDYTYHAAIVKNGNNLVESPPLKITTMDTTSHDFQWEIIEIPSPYGSGVLRDVAIINENDIWAVGEIYADSLQPWLPYNAVHWDGQQWELKRIYFPTVCGQSSLTPYPAKAIFAFDDGKIWISSSGDKIGILKDNNQISNFCLPSSVSMSINKIWGKSSNDLYIVGSGGSIARYDGSWQKVESGTDVNLRDIWGTPDGSEVWTCGWNTNTGEGILLRSHNSKWEILWHYIDPFPPHVYNSELLGSLWTDNEHKEFFITGSGDVFRHSTINIKKIKREPVSLGNYAYRIRGTERNNIFVAGDGAMVWHGNGYTWHRYDELFNIEDRLYGLAVSTSIVAAVGTRYSGINRSGLILIGRR